MNLSQEAEHFVDLIDAVVYGDSFDCAVTLDELHRFSRVSVRQDELRRRLAEPPLCHIVTERDGFYALFGREALIDRRRGRQTRALKLRRRARLVASWLQYFPFVRGVILTGSVAARDAERSADVDMLLIVRQGRIAFVFLFLGSLSRLLSREVFCPNYYLSEACLEVSRQDHYVARELMQAESLSGAGEDLFAANEWARELFPNAAPHDGAVVAGRFGSALQRLLELGLRGIVGDCLEQRLRPLVLKRLAVHHAGFDDEIPEEVRKLFDAGAELRFHGGSFVKRVMEGYTERRQEVVRRVAAKLNSRSTHVGVISI